MIEAELGSRRLESELKARAYSGGERSEKAKIDSLYEVTKRCRSGKLNMTHDMLSQKQKILSSELKIEILLSGTYEVYPV